MKGPSFGGHGVLELTGRRMAVFGSASPTMLLGSSWLLAPSGFHGTPYRCSYRPYPVWSAHGFGRGQQRTLHCRRRGEPAVVIMSVQDFIRTAAPLPDWLTKAWAGAKRRGLQNGLHRLTGTRERAKSRDHALWSIPSSDHAWKNPKQPPRRVPSS
jgi:hypothetical protein